MATSDIHDSTANTSGWCCIRWSVHWFYDILALCKNYFHMVIRFSSHNSLPLCNKPCFTIPVPWYVIILQVGCLWQMNGDKTILFKDSKELPMLEKICVYFHWYGSCFLGVFHSAPISHTWDNCLREATGLILSHRTGSFCWLDNADGGKPSSRSCSIDTFLAWEEAMK